MALRYRWSLVGSIACSFMVALLWGANMGTVYPCVEVVLKVKSLQEWVDQRLIDSESAIAASNQSIGQLQQEIAQGELDETHHRSTLGGWRFHGLPWEQC